MVNSDELIGTTKRVVLQTDVVITGFDCISILRLSARREAC
jgi:hypothetical protein